MKETKDGRDRYRYCSKRKSRADLASYVFLSFVGFMIIASVLYQVGFVLARSVK